MEHAIFPSDLMQLQADWHRTYEARAAPGRTASTVLRRRLYWLSVRLWWHPYWTGPGRMPAARTELSRQARVLLGQR
ncbi:hypothetical protein [Streptomyces sp. NRRL S-813]|uniref:hypothetical protein n=1 Tax=Streptomyces sp. NRRL S-813 TaxID=1463919 RepID=UPI0004BFA116|nr:hypothetical protein [Streptomyces sp. NRRL S-813]